MPERVSPGLGESFGPYTIESLLGRGGMGTVYLATHRRLERKVALKVIAPELAEDEDFRARFLRESQLAASLDHPNVIPIYDADQVDGVLYLAMRYVSGPSLRERIRARGRLSAAETVQIGGQIAGALDAAHARGLVHRDVKPANVLLAEPGDHAYLSDFGLAKRTSSRGTTRTGSFLGSVDYCAPEQIQGQALDGRADVYSLGCVLYHCLAGQPPYARETEFAVLHAHLEDPPPRLSESRPDLEASVDRVLDQAMAKSPDDRYPSAGALVAELRAAVEGSLAVDEPTRAAQVPATTRKARRRPAPRLWAIAGIAAILLAAVAVTIGILATRGSDTGGTSAVELRTFVDRIENVLEQSADGRREIASALEAGFDCSISHREAGRRIASVADNRQSVLAQLGTLPAPSEEADQIITRLQRALQRSIEADRHYRDGFFELSASVGCPLPHNLGFSLAAASDAQATKAKTQFVAAFDPLARRLDRRTWSASEF
jgi:serine/threonine-protein kinase